MNDINLIRLYLSAVAMQALIEKVNCQSPEHVANRSVDYADALMRKLNIL